MVVGLQLEILYVIIILKLFFDYRAFVRRPRGRKLSVHLHWQMKVRLYLSKRSRKVKAAFECYLLMDWQPSELILSIIFRRKKKERKKEQRLPTRRFFFLARFVFEFSRCRAFFFFSRNSCFFSSLLDK